MKRKLLTDIELRSHWAFGENTCYCVDDDVMLTPAAVDFIREHGITLCRTGQTPAQTMSMTPLPKRNGKPVYMDAETGRELDSKGEGMTHLRGNILVPKTHPHIAFRGQLDSLMAQILEVQVIAQEQDQSQIVSDLEELLVFARTMMASEVKNTPLASITILGLDSNQIRYHSQQVREVYGIDHPVPDYRMGGLCIALNRLRTKAREAELCAARAFCRDGLFTRLDLIEGLNRMSSCVYIIMCRKLSGYYDRENRP